MIIEKTPTEVIIRLPANVSVEGVERLLDYLTYQETIAGSLATPDQIDALAADVNRQWWERNKDRLLRP